jgi:hypothetical protein
MKKKIYLLTLYCIATGFACLSISSCKKSLSDIAPSTEYYLHCKVNGISKEFSLPDSAYFLPLPGGIYSFAGGAVDDLSSMNQLSIIINDFSGSPIEKGKTYKTVINGGITSTQAYLVWSNPGGEAYISVMSMLGPVKESAEITLTEITDKYVKGKFKGKLMADEVNSPVVKYTITDGEFYMPLGK